MRTTQCLHYFHNLELCDLKFMYKKTVSLKLVIGCNTGCISIISYYHLILFQCAQNLLIAFYIYVGPTLI